MNWSSTLDEPKASQKEASWFIVTPHFVQSEEISSWSQNYDDMDVDKGDMENMNHFLCKWKTVTFIFLAPFFSVPIRV